VDGLPELRPLRYRVVSAEVGWRKPHPRFFQKACEVAEVAPEQILVVGDDQTNDYEGAAAAGLSAVLYDPHGDHGGGATIRIGRLPELLTLVPPVP
jgi:putative hydrolase of the HAD superfamily